jgi:hypothetical protein
LILADHFAEIARPQLVGERPRRPLVKPGGGEQAWPSVERSWDRYFSAA